MSEIQCSLHYCSLQYISQIDIHYRQRHAFMVNKQNNLMGLVPYPDYPNTLMSFSSQKAEMKKCNVLSLLSNRCFFFFTWLFKEQWDQRLKLNYSQELELVCVLHLLIEKSQIKSIKELLKPLNDTTRIIQSYIYLYIDLYDVFSFSYMLNIL